jgi:hypothetical protein
MGVKFLIMVRSLFQDTAVINIAQAWSGERTIFTVEVEHHPPLCIPHRRE